MQIPFLKNKNTRRHTVLAVCLFVLAWLLFAHPDILETANHSYLFLENLFSGDILHFYENVMLHENTLYYINNAHYNIVMYLIFGVFLLPVFIVNKLFALPVQEPLIYFISKFVAIAFFFASIYLLYRITLILTEKEEDSLWVGLQTLLWPPAFFAVAIMGQYDSICLFFMLLGIYYWLKNRLTACSMWFGVAAACKFFPLILFALLILLKEKAPLKVAKYALLSLWVLIPTSLLFYGRTGDMSVFNGLMIDRVFAATFTGGVHISLFPACMLFLCVFAYIYTPNDEKESHKMSIWMGLVVFGAIFILIDWHPQWILLLAPFIVLTTYMEENRFLWSCLDITLSLGFFLICFIYYPGELEANLAYQGLLGVILKYNFFAVSEASNSISFYIMRLLPILMNLAPVLFATPIFANIVFKAPCKGKTFASTLVKSKEEVNFKPAVYLWLVFFTGIIFWALPVAFMWLKGFSFI
jgi:Predicted integral membrane protein